MKLGKRTIHIRYQAEPEPTLIAYLVQNERNNYKIISTAKHVLETYQIENGILKDFQVVGDKLLHGLGELGKVKDTVSLIYDMKHLVRFNTVLPRASLTKSKMLAKKELNEFFDSNADFYYSVSRIFSARERGMIFYFDLVPKEIVLSIDKVTNAMNHYVDAHTNLVQVVSDFFASKVSTPLDTFVIYQDDYCTHVILLFHSRLVESLAFNNDANLEEIMSGIEVLRNKHSFTFEKREVNHVALMMKSDNKLRTLWIKGLADNHFETSEIEYQDDEIVIYAIKHMDEIKQGFFQKL